MPGRRGGVIASCPQDAPPPEERNHAGRDVEQEEEEEEVAGLEGGAPRSSRHQWWL